MKFSNTLIALVLLASLGGVFYYLQKHPTTSTSADANANAKKQLFSFHGDQVKEFTMEAPGQPAATFRRVEAKGSDSDSHWEIVSSSGIAADSSGVQSFLNGLPRLQYTPLDSQTPSSLAEYGLDQPKKTFKFVPTQGQPATLSIGSDNPGSTAKYAMSSAAPGVFMLDSFDAKEFSDKTLLDLRDKRILPVSLDNAKQIELKFDLTAKSAEKDKEKKTETTPKPPKIVLAKQSNGNWQVTEPAVRTDFGNTSYFTTTLTNAQMKAVEEEDAKSLTPFGLDRPQIRVEVTTPDGTHTLLVGKKKEPKKTEDKKTDDKDKKEGEKKDEPKPEEDLGYYAKNSDKPVVFTINSALFDQLNQDLDMYRNRNLFDFETSNARRVEILGPDGELRLDKKGEDWLKAGNASAKMDATKVNTFLNEIHGLRIQHYADDKPGRLPEYGMDKPWMKVTVTFGEDNKQETILFGVKNKKFYAARQDSPSVYELDSSEPESLQPKVKDLSS